MRSENGAAADKKHEKKDAIKKAAYASGRDSEEIKAGSKFLDDRYSTEPGPRHKSINGCRRRRHVNYENQQRMNKSWSKLWTNDAHPSLYRGVSQSIHVEDGVPGDEQKMRRC